MKPILESGQAEFQQFRAEGCIVLGEDVARICFTNIPSYQYVRSSSVFRTG